MVAFDDLPDRPVGVRKEAGEVVLLPRRIGDVDEMVRHFAVFVEILSGPDVHAAVDLPGVHTDDFAVENAGQPDRQRGFTCCGRPGDDHCFEDFCHKSPKKFVKYPFRVLYYDAFHLNLKFS